MVARQGRGCVGNGMARRIRTDRPISLVDHAAIRRYRRWRGGVPNERDGNDYLATRQSGGADAHSVADSRELPGHVLAQHDRAVGSPRPRLIDFNAPEATGEILL